jgi:hypothetical protein
MDLASTRRFSHPGGSGRGRLCWVPRRCDARRKPVCGRYICHGGSDDNGQRDGSHGHDFGGRDFDHGHGNSRGRGGFGFFSPLFGLLHLVVLGGLIWLGYTFVKRSGWRVVNVNASQSVASVATPVETEVEEKKDEA